MSKKITYEDLCNMLTQIQASHLQWLKDGGHLQYREFNESLINKMTGNELNKQKESKTGEKKNKRSSS